jgi:hypothetical protein
MHNNKIKRTELPVGTEIRDRYGYVEIKISDKRWMMKHRWVAAMKMVKRELREGEKVFRLTPDRSNNDPSNLVVIQQRIRKFVPFAGAKIIRIPTRVRAEDFLLK